MKMGPRWGGREEKREESAWKVLQAAGGPSDSTWMQVVASLSLIGEVGVRSRACARAGVGEGGSGRSPSLAGGWSSQAQAGSGGQG